MLPASPALRAGPVSAAVMVVAAGPVLHETFKRPMIAIGKKHGTPPFKMNLGFAVYIRNASHGETHLRRETEKGHPHGMTLVYVHSNSACNNFFNNVIIVHGKVQ